MTTPAPPLRPHFWMYAVMDVRTTPPTAVGVAMTRQKAKDIKLWHEDADHLRVRRARALVYES